MHSLLLLLAYTLKENLVLPPWKGMFWLWIRTLQIVNQSLIYFFRLWRTMSDSYQTCSEADIRVWNYIQFLETLILLFGCSNSDSESEVSHFLIQSLNILFMRVYIWTFCSSITKSSLMLFIQYTCLYLWYNFNSLKEANNNKKTFVRL